MENGMYVRMSLLALVLGAEGLPLEGQAPIVEELVAWYHFQKKGSTTKLSKNQVLIFRIFCDDLPYASLFLTWAFSLSAVWNSSNMHKNSQLRIRFFIVIFDIERPNFERCSYKQNAFSFRWCLLLLYNRCVLFGVYVSSSVAREK